MYSIVTPEKQYADLNKISRIDHQNYISGIYPLNNTPHEAKEIDAIVCAVDPSIKLDEKNHVGLIHERLIKHNPKLVVIYIPYDDSVKQNLWTKTNAVILAGPQFVEENPKLLQELYNRYKNKYLIEIAYHFINLMNSNQRSVLVHCMAGVSRSVSLLTYYYMKKYHLSYDEAIKYIKGMRSIANPNDCFAKQLKKYEKKREKHTHKDSHHIISEYKTHIISSASINLNNIILHKLNDTISFD